MRSRSVTFALLVALLLALAATVGVARAGAESFLAPKDYPAGCDPYGIAVGDFNGDGIQDLTVTGDFNSCVNVLRGNGSGGFGAADTYSTGALCRSVAVGDFNGDGVADLATAQFSDKQISVLLGDGSGGFGAATYYDVGTGPVGITVGDFDRDGALDLATADPNASAVRVFFGNGHGAFGAHVDVAAGSGPQALAVGDFNGDGVQDLVTGNSGNSVSVLLGTGTGSFGAPALFPAGAFPRSIVVADFDRDGNDDVATADTPANAVSVLLGDGNGVLGTHVDYSTDLTPLSIAVGDFNGDGRPDLVTADSGDGDVSVLLGDGQGAFGNADDWLTNTDPVAVATGDFNGDGKTDIAVGDNANSVVSVLLGKFEVPYGTMAIDNSVSSTSSRVVEIDSLVAEATQMRIRDANAKWGAWQPYSERTLWTLPPGDGADTVEVQYRNPVTAPLLLIRTILLDTTPPATTDDAPAGWRTGNVTVHLTPDDGAGAGVAKTQYKVDNATGWNDGTSVNLSTDGIRTIKYRSTDAAGNVEDTQFCTVRIDSTAPVTTVFGVDDLWHNGPVMVLFSARDALSGVDYTEYKLDTGPTVQGIGLLVTTNGDHVLQFDSSDVAGNEEDSQLVHVRIDTVKPTTTATAVKVKRNKTATLKYTVKDATPCGPNADVTILIKNAKGKTVMTIPQLDMPVNMAHTYAFKCTLAKGTYTYVVQAIDGAGNSQSRAGSANLTVY